MTEVEAKEDTEMASGDIVGDSEGKMESDQPWLGQGGGCQGGVPGALGQPQMSWGNYNELL